MRVFNRIYEVLVHSSHAQDLVSVKAKTLIKHENESDYLHIIVENAQIENNWYLTPEEWEEVSKKITDIYLTYHA